MTRLIKSAILIAAAALSWPGSLRAQSCEAARALSDREIRQELAGHRLSGYSLRTKARWSETLYPDGVTEFVNARGKKTFGRWRIRSGQICFSYGTMTEWTCKSVHLVSDGCRSFKLALRDDAGKITSGILSTSALAGTIRTPDRPLEIAIAREKQWSRGRRAGVQKALIWSGDFSGRADGQIGTATRTAIRAFQRREGADTTGYLTEAQADRLEDIRMRAERRIGFRVVEDYEAGIRLGIPERIFERSGTERDRMTYRARPSQSRSSLMLISFAGSARDAADLYRDLSAPDRVSAGAYMVQKPDWFVISDTRGVRSTYTYVRAGDGAVKGFSLIWPSGEDARFKPIAIAMYNTFDVLPGVLDASQARSSDPFRDPVPRARPAPAPRTGPLTGQDRIGRIDTPRAAARPPKPRMAPSRTTGTGTGFVLDRGGHVLTNAHVVEGCRRVQVGDGIAADPVRVDGRLDLALLRARGGTWQQTAEFAPAPARLNSDVTVIGFPLHGILGGLNVTRGSISALTGLKGDTNHFQMSAAVQPGNSGGPVLDGHGSVVGVVQSKLNALKIAKSTGDIPQNINFAIRGEIAKLFVSVAGLVPKIRQGDTRLGPADLAERAQGYTVLVRCLN